MGMVWTLNKILLAWCLLLTLTACGMSPVYINESGADKSQNQARGLSLVHFKFEPAFHQIPPSCVAIMPLRKQIKMAFLPETGPLINDKELKQLRRTLYSQLAPYPYKDVEIAQVNAAIAKYGQLPMSYARVAAELGCDSLLLGDVAHYEAQFYGVYSHTSIGIKLRLIRAENNQLLWQGRHVALSHAGSIPLTPVGIAMGIISATSNVSDKQVARVGDDLFRRLLSTWGGGSEALDEQGVALAQLDQASFYVISPQLNLRSGPGMQFSASTVLNQNDPLTLLSE